MPSMKKKSLIDRICDPKTLGWIAFATIIFAILAPFIFTRCCGFIVFDNETGVIGDTFGIMNPFIAIAAAIITFAAFLIQYQANVNMLEENKKQREDNQKEQENIRINNQREQVITRFYEMLNIHRDNVKELEWDQKIYDAESLYTTCRIKNKCGRGKFLFYLIEFNAIYKIIETLYGNIDFKEKTKRAYNIFYKGVRDERFSFTLRQEILNKISSSSREIYFDTASFFPRNNTPDYITNKTDLLNAAVELYNHKAFFLTNQPFYGHFEELNNYYRHLFLTVKTIGKEDETYLPYHEKRNLLRILRAQLTSTEQIMLFYNWFSGNGEKWEEESNDGNHFFTKYRMIHNIMPHWIIPFQKKEKNNDKSYRRFISYFANCKSVLKYGTSKDPIFEFEDWEGFPKFSYKE